MCVALSPRCGGALDFSAHFGANFDCNTSPIATKDPVDSGGSPPTRPRGVTVDSTCICHRALVAIYRQPWGQRPFCTCETPSEHLSFFSLFIGEPISSVIRITCSFENRRRLMPHSRCELSIMAQGGLKVSYP